jgi:N-acetyl sugar amidotransferase
MITNSITNSRSYQQCKRCIMDTTDPEIYFDNDGNCNHCNAFFKLAPNYIYQGEASDKKLSELVEKIKKDGKKSDYDCIIGVSGGVDSTYVAYIAKKLGLRILAFHFDNGWNSELAVKNIENIVKKLDVDYQTWVVDWIEFRDIQLSFLKSSLANAETPSDHAFLAATYHLCKKHNVKYFLSGSNFATEGILPKSWGYNAKDVKHLKAVHKQFGKIPFKTYPLLGFYKEFYYTYIKKIKMIRLLNYIPYVKEDAMKVIEKELGWVYYGGKHYESIFTRFFQAYYLPKKFNFDKRLAHLSTLICAGEITRDKALEEIQKDAYPPDLLVTDKLYVEKKLGLNSNELENIINAPAKHYTDYPNDSKRLKFIYKVYYKLRRKK